ncbi:MAG: AI-2E family transporter [Capsulimonadaceae bacterium]|nr:AI-2E family transporter [Capsulimonadaceae bacterium]
MENTEHDTPAETPVEAISLRKWIRLLVVCSSLLLLGGLVYVGVHLASAIHHTLLLFALGALIAYALDPLVERVRHIRVAKGRKPLRTPSRGATVGMLFFVLIVFFAIGVAWLGHQMQGQIAYLETDFPLLKQRALNLAVRTDGILADHHVRYSVEDLVHNPPPEVKQALGKIGLAVIPALTHAFANIAESIIVLLISVYFLIFASEMREKVNACLPAPIRTYAELWETDVNRIFGGFVRGQILIALLMGAATGLACLAIGIHLWLMIGLFVVVAALIPVFGPYIGAVPAIVAALVGPTHFHNPVVAAIVVLIVFVVINEAGSKILYPRLVGAALGLHEVLVLFVLFAGLEVGGIVGVLFAAPVTAFVIVTIVHVYRYWQNLPDDLISENRPVSTPSALLK